MATITQSQKGVSCSTVSRRRGEHIDFKLTPKHEMTRKSVREFVEKEIKPIAADVDKMGEFPVATVTFTLEGL